MLIKIHYYYRRHCSLCDALKDDLDRYLHEKKYDELCTVVSHDIETNEEWLRRYSEYVPTVVINREEVSHYFLDREDLDQAIQACINQQPD